MAWRISFRESWSDNNFTNLTQIDEFIIIHLFSPLFSFHFISFTTKIHSWIICDLFFVCLEFITTHMYLYNNIIYQQSFLCLLCLHHRMWKHIFMSVSKGIVVKASSCVWKGLKRLQNNNNKIKITIWKSLSIQCHSFSDYLFHIYEHKKCDSMSI